MSTKLMILSNFQLTMIEALTDAMRTQHLLRQSWASVDYKCKFLKKRHCSRFFYEGKHWGVVRYNTTPPNTQSRAVQ